MELLNNRNREIEHLFYRKFEIVDADSGIRIALNYDYVNSYFSEGRALVNYGLENCGVQPQGGKFGFIDCNGKEIVPCIYDDANNYSCGFARVRLNGKMMEIDYNGKPLDVPCDEIPVDIYEETETLSRAEIERMTQFLNAEPHNIGYRIILVNLYIELIYILINANHCEESQEFIDKAIEIAEKGLKEAPEDPLLNYTYGQIFKSSTCHHIMNNSPYKVAIIPARKCAAIFERLSLKYPDDTDVRIELVLAYTSLSSIFVDNKRHIKESIDYAEKTLILQEHCSSAEANISFEHHVLYKNMGKAYKQMKNRELYQYYILLNLEKCKRCYNPSIFMDFSLYELVDAYLLAGELYMEKHELQQALDYFNKATEYVFLLIEKEKNNYNYIKIYAECFYNLFTVYRKLNREEEALNYSERALAEYSKIHIEQEMEVLWKQMEEMRSFITENSSEVI